MKRVLSMVNFARKERNRKIQNLKISFGQKKSLSPKKLGLDTLKIVSLLFFSLFFLSFFLSFFLQIKVRQRLYV